MTMARPALADWQRDLVLSSLHGDPAAAARLQSALVAGPVPAAEALEIHARTVHHALYSALRQRVPTVEALVGEDFMRELTRAFARQDPPRQPQLALWGDEFPAFIVGHAGCQSLPNLADVAAFDLALDEVALARAGCWLEPWQLTENLRLQCLDSLRIFAANYPVDLLRDAVAEAKEGDATALESFRWVTGDHHYALWCAADSQVHCRAVSAGLAAFMVALLANYAAAASGQREEDGGLESNEEVVVENALQSALAATGTADEGAATLFTQVLQELAGMGGASLFTVE